MASIGVTQRKLGNLRQSRYSLNEAIQAVTEESKEEASALAYALDNLGITALREGDPASARESFERALSLRNRHGDQAGSAETLLNLARLERRGRNIGRAMEQCTEALRRLGDSPSGGTYAAAKALMGELLQATGDLSAAEEAFREALRENEASGRPASIALSILQLARLMLDRGELDEARRLAERALNENTHASNKEGIVASQHLLGRVALASNRTGDAIAMLQECVNAYENIGNPTGEAWARLHLAKALTLSGQEAEATENVRRAGAIAERTGTTDLKSALAEFDE